MRARGERAETDRAVATDYAELSTGRNDLDLDRADPSRAAARTEHSLADKRIDLVAGIQETDQMLVGGRGQRSGLGNSRPSPTHCVNAVTCHSAGASTLPRR